MLKQLTNLKISEHIFTRYFIYLIRWQLSTPILAICVGVFAYLGNLWATIIANFIGGLVFFWIDRFIFYHKYTSALWEIKKNIICCDCKQKVRRGYRLVLYEKYNRTKDTNPQWRCENCSIHKFENTFIQN